MTFYMIYQHYKALAFFFILPRSSLVPVTLATTLNIENILLLKQLLLVPLLAREETIICRASWLGALLTTIITKRHRERVPGMPPFLVCREYSTSTT